MYKSPIVVMFASLVATLGFLGVSFFYPKIIGQPGHLSTHQILQTSAFFTLMLAFLSMCVGIILNGGQPNEPK